MNTQTKFAASVVLLLLVSPLTADEPQPDQRHTSLFMRAKLSSSNKVMEGVVTEHFDLIRQAALDMKKMSQATQWPTSDDGTYQHFQRAFQYDCDRLATLAAEQNLTGAHFTFLQLTNNCVSCHEYVRRAFQVKRNKQDPRGPVMLIPNHWEDDKTSTEAEASFRATRHPASAIKPHGASRG